MRRGLALLLMVGFLILVAGCASTRALNADELAQLRAAPELRVVHALPSTLSVMTPGRTTAGLIGGALGGAIGGAIVGGIVAANARSEGKQLVADYRLDDPAAVVKERVVAALVEQQALPGSLTSVPSAVVSTDADALAKAFPGATILAFRTDRWEINHFGSEYGVIYHASAHLVRTSDAKEMWKLKCELDGKDFPKLSMAELKADDGVLLRTRLQRSAELCAEKLVQQIMGSTISASVKP